MEEENLITLSISWFKDTNIQAAVLGPLASAIIGAASYLFQGSKVTKANTAKLIHDIEETSIRHWCCLSTDANNRSRGVSIQSHLQRLATRIKKLDADEEMIAFRQAITSGNFSDNARQHVDFDSPTIRLIQTTANSLRKKLKLEAY